MDHTDPTIPRQAPPAQAGVGLMELLISMALAAVLLTSMFGLYAGAARNAAGHESEAAADRESRLVLSKLSRDFRLVGLLAPADADGDSNDILRDVPGLAWSDSLRSDFEHANTYDLVFTADIDDDGATETVRYFHNPETDRLCETLWEWSRDSLRWSAPVTRNVAKNVDYLLYRYFDRNGNTVPSPVTYPAGGYTLTMAERLRVTAVEVTVVTRSEREVNGYPQRTYLPDGAYWHDGYKRNISRFMIRGRNLSLGS